jgi:hypothetical protein
LERAVASNLVFAHLQSIDKLSFQELIEILYQLDAFRKPYLISFIQKLYEDKVTRLVNSFEFVFTVNVQDVDQNLKGKEIGDAIKLERIRRLEVKGKV